MDFMNTSDRISAASNINATVNDVFKQEEQLWITVALALSWVCTVLILSLNTAVIICICTYQKRPKLYFFLLNLAIADLCTGLLDTLVNSIGRVLSLGHGILIWEGPSFLCPVQRGLANVCLFASNFLLAATCIDRALAVAQPFSVLRRRKRTCVIIVASCWAISALACLPWFLAFETIVTMTSEDQLVSVCVNQGTFISTQVTSVYFAVFGFLIPIILIVASFGILLVTVGKRSISDTHSGGTFGLNKLVPRAKMKGVKLMLGIVPGFLVSCVPVLNVVSLVVYTGFKHPSVALVVLLFNINNITNPVVFFAYHHQRNKRSPGNNRTSIIPNSSSQC